VEASISTAQEKKDEEENKDGEKLGTSHGPLFWPHPKQLLLNTLVRKTNKAVSDGTKPRRRLVCFFAFFSYRRTRNNVAVHQS